MTDAPAADAANADNPAPDNLAADNPAADNPAPDNLAADNPGADKPAADAADAAAGVHRLGPVRRVAGIVLAAVTVLLAAGYALALWNPWRLVALTEYFGSWPLGVLLVSVLALGTSWVLWPVRHEVAQGRRIVLRIVCAVVALVSLVCWGIVGSAFNRESSVLARSPDGARALVVVTRGEDRELQVWVGEGLVARDVGTVGPACGEVTARFLGPDRIAIATNYGDFQIDLAPDTGVPLRGIGSRCRGSD